MGRIPLDQLGGRYLKRGWQRRRRAGHGGRQCLRNHRCGHIWLLGGGIGTMRRSAAARGGGRRRRRQQVVERNLTWPAATVSSGREQRSYQTGRLSGERYAGGGRGIGSQRGADNLQENTFNKIDSDFPNSQLTELFRNFRRLLFDPFRMSRALSRRFTIRATLISPFTRLLLK